MALTKQQKADLIAQYTETLAQEGALVLLEQRGLPVDGVVSFKKELATTSGTSRVVKKRLLLQTAGLEDFSPLKVVLKMNKLFKKEGQQY